MVRFSRIAASALCIVVSTACTASETAPADSAVTAAAPDPVADEQAIRALNTAWFEAHRAGNIEGVVGSYSSDATVSAPGFAPARGTAAIRELFTKEIQGMAAAGMSEAAGANPELVVSGDLAYEWNTYVVTDKSGKTIDTGKYLSVFGRRDGKWVIISDIWNSDAAPTASS